MTSLSDIVFPKAAAKKSVYLRYAIIFSAVFFTYLFVGFAAIKLIFLGENWFTNRRLALGFALAAIVFARLHYVSMLQYDGEIGSGKKWTSHEASVSLPEPKSNAG